MNFIPGETVDAVLPGEGGGAVVLVARDSLPEVGGDADVQGAVALAGEDVDGGGFGGGHGGMVEAGAEGSWRWEAGRSGWLGCAVIDYGARSPPFDRLRAGSSRG